MLFNREKRHLYTLDELHNLHTIGTMTCGGREYVIRTHACTESSDYAINILHI